MSDLSVKCMGEQRLRDIAAYADAIAMVSHGGEVPARIIRECVENIRELKRRLEELQRPSHLRPERE